MRITVLFSTLAAVLGATPADAKLAFMWEQGSDKAIYIANDDGSERERVSRQGLWALYPDLSPDARQIAFTQGEDPSDLRITIVDLDSRAEQIISGPGFNLQPEFSGDGRYLVYTGQTQADSSRHGVHVVDLTTTAQTPTLIEDQHSAYFPNISSDGTFVVFQRNLSATEKQIAMWNRGTAEITELTTATDYAMSPTLSSDDRYVVFSRRIGEQWNLWQLDLWTSEQTQLTDTPYQEFAPTFDPSGALAFASNRTGEFQLYQFEASCRQGVACSFVELVTGEGSFYAPSFSGNTNYKLASLPEIAGEGRSSFGAVAYEGNVYVVGGHQGPEHTYPPESFSDRLTVYNESTGEWSELARLSLARHGFSVVAHEGGIYAFGGFTYSPDHLPKWKSVDLVERYDIASNTWEVVGHLPRPRSSNVVAKVGDFVYLIGGWDSTPQSENDYEGRFHDQIDLFDLNTHQSVTLEQTLQAPKRRALSAVVRGTEIILVGGLGQGASHFELLDNVTGFETMTGEWTEYKNLPFATFAPATGLIGDDLFVFGGMFKTGAFEYNYVNHIYGLSLVDGSSFAHTGRHLSEAKGFSQVVEMGDGRLGILGGHTYQGEVDHPVSTFETFEKR